MKFTKDETRQAATALAEKLETTTGVEWTDGMHPVHFLGRKRGWLPTALFICEATCTQVVVIEGHDGTYNAEIRGRGADYDYTDVFDDPVACAMAAFESVRLDLYMVRENADVDVEFLTNILER